MMALLCKIEEIQVISENTVNSKICEKNANDNFQTNNKDFPLMLKSNNRKRYNFPSSSASKKRSFSQGPKFSLFQNKT